MVTAGRRTPPLDYYTGRPDANHDIGSHRAEHKYSREHKSDQTSEKHKSFSLSTLNKPRSVRVDPERGAKQKRAATSEAAAHDAY